jgi:hypothetical protein
MFSPDVFAMHFIKPFNKKPPPFVQAMVSE